MKKIVACLGTLIALSLFLACSKENPVTPPVTDPVAPAGMRYIKGGTFSMGSADVNYANEQPAHQVTVSAFFIDTVLVTQEKFRTLMDTNPSQFKPGDGVAADFAWQTLPVEQATWFDAVLYCNARSKAQGKDTVYTYTGITGFPGFGCRDLINISYDLSKNGYRLPTEAEWEYACRAGTTTDYYWGNTFDDSYCWWDGNCYDSTNNKNSLPGMKMTHRVGLKKPNAWKLYDMVGNVWEWCNDWYGDYTAAAQTNPVGVTTGILDVRAMRGGSFLSYMETDMRSSARAAQPPGARASGSIYGVRPVCNAK